MPDRISVQSIKDKYLPGTKIRLVRMDDPYTKLKAGLAGTVSHVDDIGTIHMNWENGSTLGLIPGEDDFYIIKN